MQGKDYISINNRHYLLKLYKEPRGLKDSIYKSNDYYITIETKPLHLIYCHKILKDKASLDLDYLSKPK
jgi:hypothetical protein